MKSIHLKSRVALFYKTFLYSLFISQIVLFCLLIISQPFMAIFNLILVIYFGIRIHVFTKVERLAKASGMTIFDYMKRFQKEHKDF